MGSSYEELLRQVASLKKENNELRRELGDENVSQTGGSNDDLTNVSEGRCDLVAISSLDNEEFSEINDFSEMNENSVSGSLSQLQFKKSQLHSEIMRCEQENNDTLHISELRENMRQVDEKLKICDEDTCSKDGISGKEDDVKLKLNYGTWNLNENGNHTSVADDASVNSFKSTDLISNISLTKSDDDSDKPLASKVEMIYSLLIMLGKHDKSDISKTLLTMSRSQESCNSMRQSGCLPILIQLLHGDASEIISTSSCTSSDSDSTHTTSLSRADPESRSRASAALHNIVHSHPDDKRGRKEARSLRLLEQVRAFTNLSLDNKFIEGSDHDAGPAIAVLMRLSFDEEHRHAICTLGGVQAIAELLTLQTSSTSIQRYACMALTNLTFGDGTNKALLCSMRSPLKSIIGQLSADDNDLRQVSASVLRNLSWRADLASKLSLRENGSVQALMLSAMMPVDKSIALHTSEAALKSILSALWNLSAHCRINKVTICEIEGALPFLIDTLSHSSAAIVENGGGVLRNVSSVIASSQHLRQILRTRDTLHILLDQLRAPSLVIVSNACGSLWNLSARCVIDQQRLWTLGAVAMLRRLVDSRHRMIATGSAAALKNLLAGRSSLNLDPDITDTATASSTASSDGHGSSNRLYVRRQRDSVLNAEDIAEDIARRKDLEETCDNVDSPRHSPSTSIANALPNCTYEVKKPCKDPIEVRKLNDLQNQAADESINFSIRFDETTPHDPRAPYIRETSDASTTSGSSSSATTDNRIAGKRGPPPPAATNVYLDHGTDAINDDSDNLRTYCTEGTPLNFLSTATSLTDLTQTEHSQQETSHDDDVEDIIEKPIKYSTEDTPLSFSRESSLSSLANTSSFSAPGASNDAAIFDIHDNSSSLRVLPSIDENSSLDIGNNRKSYVKVPAKSVTFDVDQSPMMFSRSSSLGSLSSFDTHSVHSSVVSDYSRRTSQVVSPSELPDSPSDTMPGTSPPTQRECLREPVLRGRTPGEESDTVVDVVGAGDMTQWSYDTQSIAAGSELSVLTLDEPRILKDSDLRRMPLAGEEDEDEDDLNITGVTVIAAPTVKRNLVSPTSDEDRLLQDCISLGMPPRSVKRKSRHSQRNSPVEVIEDSNEEVLCSFATEDTPLTFSRADSDLSDISFDDKPETDKRHLINHRSSSEDLSDDLLSAAIEAGKPPARPKRQTPSKLRTHVDVVRSSMGQSPNTSPDHKFNRSRGPKLGFISKLRTPNKAPATPPVGYDTPPRCYDIEGTPNYFSSNSSLSSLASSLEDLEEGIERLKLDEPCPPSPKPLLCIPEEVLITSPHLYAVEDTPDGILSRRSSLSSLSVDLTDDDDDVPVTGDLSLTYTSVAPPTDDLRDETMPIMSVSLMTGIQIPPGGTIVLESFCTQSEPSTRCHPPPPSVSVKRNVKTTQIRSTTRNTTTGQIQRVKAVSKIASIWKSPGPVTKSISATSTSPISRSRTPLNSTKAPVKQGLSKTIASKPTTYNSTNVNSKTFKSKPISKPTISGVKSPSLYNTKTTNGKTGVSIKSTLTNSRITSNVKNSLANSKTTPTNTRVTSKTTPVLTKNKMIASKTPPLKTTPVHSKYSQSNTRTSLNGKSSPVMSKPITKTTFSSKAKLTATNKSPPMSKQTKLLKSDQSKSKSVVSSKVIASTKSKQSLTSPEEVGVEKKDLKSEDIPSADEIKSLNLKNQSNNRLVKSATFDKLEDEKKSKNRLTYTIGKRDERDIRKAFTLPNNLSMTAEKVTSKPRVSSLFRRQKNKDNKTTAVTTPSNKDTSVKVNSVKPTKEFSIKNKENKITNKDILKIFSNPFKKSNKEQLTTTIDIETLSTHSDEILPTAGTPPRERKRITSAPSSPRSANEAIVPPYNYIPIASEDILSKTDMLIARRQRNTSECSESERSACLVTTV